MILTVQVWQNSWKSWYANSWNLGNTALVLWGMLVLFFFFFLVLQIVGHCVQIKNLKCFQSACIWTRTLCPLLLPLIPNVESNLCQAIHPDLPLGNKDAYTWIQSEDELPQLQPTRLFKAQFKSPLFIR